MTPQPRRIVAVTGADALDFLQGLVSNDLLAFRSSDGIVHTALLTPQGKYLADFFVLRWQGELLLDLPEALADQTINRLNMYRLRADVRLIASPLQMARGTGPAPDGALRDPRHLALGWRSYGALATDDGTDWDLIRVDHVIPETLRELFPDESYILECGFERLNGVDFRKGCYVGQEVTARMKHKTELRKGLARIALSAPLAYGTEIKLGEKVIGRVLTVAGDHAIAYLRMEQIQPGITAGPSTVEIVPPACR